MAQICLRSIILHQLDFFAFKTNLDLPISVVTRALTAFPPDSWRTATKSLQDGMVRIRPVTNVPANQIQKSANAQRKSLHNGPLSVAAAKDRKSSDPLGAFLDRIFPLQLTLSVNYSEFFICGEEVEHVRQKHLDSYGHKRRA